MLIPFSDKVTPEMRSAIGQLWQWSNYQMMKNLIVRYTAIAGNSLVEVNDDVEAGKIRFDTVWASLVDPEFLMLDAVGNVKQHALEYMVTDIETGEDFMFRKEVTRQDEIRYYRDEKAYEREGKPAVQANPYEFDPAVWFKHTDLGGDFGGSVFRGDFSKLDEWNSLGTHGLDVLHKTMDPAVVMWGDGNVIPLLKDPDAQDAEASAAGYDVQRDIMLWKGPSGGQAQNIISSVDWEGYAKEMERLQTEIEGSHAELTLFSELRKMSQVTGPGAAFLLGDATAPYDEACSNYDWGNEHLFQMAVAIGGFRLQEGAGGWSEPTDRQLKFASFDLTSYDEDDLTVEILPRELIPTTEEDEIALKGKKIGLANQASGVLPIEGQARLGRCQ